MLKIRNWIALVKFAFWFFKLAYENEENESEIVREIVKRYKRQLPIASYMDMYWTWTNRAEHIETKMSREKTIVTFYWRQK